MQVDVTDANFNEEVLQSELPVLVDFWAPWCGPCHMVSPIVAEIGEEQHGKLKVCKCNVDEANSTAANYGIMAIPTLLMFKDGEVAEQVVGVVSRDRLMSKVQEHL